MTSNNGADTIYALASGQGRAGVAVIRVSGADAFLSLESLTSQPLPQVRRTALRVLRHPVSRETLDEAMVICFHGPASFTGEDVVEYHLHGGRAIIDSVVMALSAQPGHRMAEPGEFTRRAFLNNKMDLTQAEALNDLIHAETQYQKLQALDQMSGQLSDLYKGWAERLKKALAYLEADLDFPDEDLPDGAIGMARPALTRIGGEIKSHLEDNRRGERLREGLQIAIIGAPNAGKSSLLNALAQRDVAIVSDIAGTTRDVLDVQLDLGGYPVVIADTAGLRPQELGASDADIIESEGIKRALKRAEAADIRLLMFDASKLPEMDLHTQALIRDQDILVFNKSDLLKDTPPAQGFLISVSQGTGLNSLVEGITQRVAEEFEAKAGPVLTRQRHREALTQALAALNKALAPQELPELIAEDVRLAMREIGRITGHVDVEDLLDVIFKDFCIGK